MKPETIDFLAKANRCLQQARTIRDAGVAEVAARTAYLAGFHAAQAFLFEETGRLFKTHKGVHSEFGLLAKQRPAFVEELRGFLPRTYRYKAIADYGVGQEAEVTLEEAESAIDKAEKLIATVARGLEAPGPD